MNPPFVVWVILVVVAVSLLLIRLEKGTADGAQAALMPQRTRATLITYLLGIGFLLLYLLIHTYAVEFPEGVAAAGQPPIDAPNVACTTAPLPTLRLMHVFPYLVRGTPPGTAPTYALAVYGDGFSDDAKVRLNGMTRETKRRANCNLIVIASEQGDLDSIGTVIVDVVRPAAASATPGQPTVDASNAIIVSIGPQREDLWILWEHWAITRQMHLLLLVMIAGALGSFVHALKSLADYIGNRTAVSSWFWFYISRPFMGATMAVIFYSVIRGGFLTGASVDANVVNPFGAVAIAALVGMFADKATQKLAQVFEVFFKTDDQRTGKLAGPAIQKLVPGTVRTGDTAPVDVKIVGDRLGKATAVKVNDVERAPISVAEKEVVFRVLAADMAATGDLNVSVVTPDGASPAVRLHVSDLEISAAAAPPNATVGTQYSFTPTASGGTQPLSWSLAGKLAGCTLDPKTGAISGTPTAAGKVTLVLTVTDKNDASHSLSFDILVA